MTSQTIPTLANARPVDSHQEGLIFGCATDVHAFSYRRVPAVEGRRSGTFDVLRDVSQKRTPVPHTPGTPIAASPDAPKDAVAYDMFIGADAALIPDLAAQATQYGGDPVDRGRAIAHDKALKTWRKMRQLMCDREQRFASFLTTSTWNSGSTTLAGANSWRNPASDIPTYLQTAKKALNAGDANLVLIVNLPVYYGLQENTALRAGLPVDAMRHLVTDKTAPEVLGQWGIKELWVSSAAYTPNGADFIMPDIAVLAVLEDAQQMIPEFMPVNPSAFVRLVEPLRPEGPVTVGRPITFGDNPAEDFFIREGYNQDLGGQVTQVLYSDCFKQARARLGFRYTMA